LRLYSFTQALGAIANPVGHRHTTVRPRKLKTHWWLPHHQFATDLAFYMGQSGIYGPVGFLWSL